MKIHIIKETDRRGGSADRAPILIVPYMWIGDFVRCHSVVNLLRERFPRPSGRHAGDHVVRAAGRLHARAAAGGCRRLAARPARTGASS